MIKKILIIVTLISIIATGCTSKNDIESEVETKKPDITIDISDENQNPSLESPIVKQPIVEDTVSIDIGLKSPDFTLINLAGEEVTLSDYEGKIVLLNFWATWCKWCDMEMPDLNKLDKENEDLVVLAVNVMEDESTVKKYIEKGQYEFEVVLDKEGKIANNYLIEGLPNSYFIDKEGILQLRYPGMLTYDQMMQVIDAMREMEKSQ